MLQVDITRFKRYKYHFTILFTAGIVITIYTYKSFFDSLTSKLMQLPFIMLCVVITFYQIVRRKELEIGINYFILGDFVLYTHESEDDKDEIDDYIKECFLVQFPQFNKQQLNRAFAIFIRSLEFYVTTTDDVNDLDFAYQFDNRNDKDELLPILTAYEFYYELERRYALYSFFYYLSNQKFLNVMRTIPLCITSFLSYHFYVANFCIFLLCLFNHFFDSSNCRFITKPITYSLWINYLIDIDLYDINQDIDLTYYSFMSLYKYLFILSVGVELPINVYIFLNITYYFVSVFLAFCCIELVNCCIYKYIFPFVLEFYNMKVKEKNDISIDDLENDIDNEENDNLNNNCNHIEENSIIVSKEDGYNEEENDKEEKEMDNDEVEEEEDLNNEDDDIDNEEVIEYEIQGKSEEEKENEDIDDDEYEEMEEEEGEEDNQEEVEEQQQQVVEDGENEEEESQEDIPDELILINQNLSSFFLPVNIINDNSVGGVIIVIIASLCFGLIPLQNVLLVKIPHELQLILMISSLNIFIYLFCVFKYVPIVLWIIQFIVSFIIHLVLYLIFNYDFISSDHFLFDVVFISTILHWKYSFLFKNVPEVIHMVISISLISYLYNNLNQFQLFNEILTKYNHSSLFFSTPYSYGFQFLSSFSEFYMYFLLHVDIGRFDSVLKNEIWYVIGRGIV